MYAGDVGNMVTAASCPMHTGILALMRFYLLVQMHGTDTKPALLHALTHAEMYALSHLLKVFRD